MQSRPFFTGILIGTVLALFAVLVIVPTVASLRATPPDSPQLPEGVTASTESGVEPYAGLENGVLQSYWIPFIEFVRERYPDARIYYAYRRRSLALGGRMHRQRNDPNTLVGMLRESAADTGWEPIRDMDISNAVYHFECFGQSGYVYCIFAFTDMLRRGPSDTMVLSFDAFRTPPEGDGDFAAVYIITDIADTRAKPPPGISPSAKPLKGR